MRVDTTVYTPDEPRNFRAELTTKLGKDVGRVAKRLGEIITDLLNEDLVFADWPAVVKEVVIRSVGYEAEAKMRELMVEHQGRYERQKEEAERNVRQAEKDWVDDLQKNVIERRFKTPADKTNYVNEQKNSVLNGVLGYRKASYMTRYSAEWRMLPLYRWIIGEVQNEPLAMNCWEAVLFSLVKTGLVDKTYIGWCNTMGKPEEYWGQEGSGIFPVLLQKLIDGMDYYYGTHNAFGPQQALHKDSPANFMVVESAAFAVPANQIIPRGRVLMFNLGEHVAISTGKLVQITDPELQRIFGNIGHGMLELDAGYNSCPGNAQTIREGYIEELVYRNYFRNLVVAPYPACEKSGTITFRGQSKSTAEQDAEVVAAKQRYIYGQQEKIDKLKKAVFKKRDDRLKQISQRQLSTPADATDKREKLEEEITKVGTLTEMEIKKIENQVLTDWKSLNETKRLLREAESRVQLPETITLQYNVNNPYAPRQR